MPTISAIDPLRVTSRGARGEPHCTGGQLELFSMEKMYRDRVCSSKAQTSDSRFSYSCSMLDLPWHALRYRLVGWSPGTAME